ncbi:MAG: diadenylate cyclase [Planctomycetota bacterium]
MDRKTTLQLLWTFLHELPRTFRPADAVDITIIAVFLYSALVWFRETASRRIAVGVTAIIVLYFLAVTFNLYLTSQVLHAGFAIVLIMLVVIFQEDLRRGLERLATIGAFRQFRQTVPPPSELDTLVEATFAMAEAKVGALLVLQGRDELDRHIHGGIPLGGQISKPLLDSIFDANSAGHDGAAIIRGGRVDRFAVHLPISKNREEIGPRGTRHAAALGIAERCDALTIVVSEERRIVSIAEDGRLQAVVSPAELKGRLEQFMAVKFSVQTESPWRQFVVRHWPTKALALLLAMVAWILFAYNPSTIQRTFEVPIEYRNVPAGLVLAESAPGETRVTLSGTEPAYRLLEPATLKISLDLATAVEGSLKVAVEPANLNTPANLSLYGIEHNTIRLYLSKRPDPPIPVVPKIEPVPAK